MTSSIDDDLTTTVDGEPRLVAARCSACGTHVFPVQAACARCGELTERTPLPVRGVVWSWTVQRLAPKPPFEVHGEFEPFAVAYVDLGPLKVESRLKGRAPDEWGIGDAVQLVVAARGEGAPAFWFEEVAE